MLSYTAFSLFVFHGTVDPRNLHLSIRRQRQMCIRDRYTPVTGIWQTVWLEPVAKTHLSDFLIVPDIDNEQMKITLMPNALSDDMSAVIRVLADKKEVTKMKVSSFGEELQIPVKNPRLWSPESPFLYDVEIELQKDGKTVDIVKSYAGMRKIALERKDGKPCIYLNLSLIHISEPTRQAEISYAVFCLKKKK